MRLVIQIPCLNEAETLPATLAALPRAVPGFDDVIWLVVDDGSTDDTSKIAEEAGAVVVRHRGRRGLARAFATGIDEALRLGADVIVNTDGDNQYVGADLAAVAAPVLAGEADLVIGDRDPAHNLHFSWMKRRIQVIGTGVVNALAGVTVRDAASGCRAFSREAALSLVVLSDFTWSVEVLVQAGTLGLGLRDVPVRTNPPTRPSRLFRSTRAYVFNNGATLLRAFTWYRPWLAFGVPAFAFYLISSIFILRFLYFYFTLPISGHVQSVVLAAGAGTAAFVLTVAAALADAQRASRRLSLEILRRLRREELATLSASGGSPPGPGPR